MWYSYKKQSVYGLTTKNGVKSVHVGVKTNNFKMYGLKPKRAINTCV